MFALACVVVFFVFLLTPASLHICSNVHRQSAHVNTGTVCSLNSSANWIRPLIGAWQRAWRRWDQIQHDSRQHYVTVTAAVFLHLLYICCGSPRSQPNSTQGCSHNRSLQCKPQHGLHTIQYASAKRLQSCNTMGCFTHEVFYVQRQSMSAVV